MGHIGIGSACPMPSISNSFAPGIVPGDTGEKGNGSWFNVARVVSVFRELRSGQSEDGRIKFKTPSGTMSTAEAISVMVQGLAMAAHLGDGSLHFDDLLAGIESTVVKDPVHDAVVWREYLDSLSIR